MATMKLTERRIKELTIEDGRDYEYIWDEVVSGLGVKITAKGKKRYIFKSEFSGKKDAKPIWHFAPLCEEYSLEEMRDDAREWKVMINKGINPFQRRNISIPTMAELAGENLKARETRIPPLSKYTLQDDRLMTKYIKESGFGKFSVDEVTIKDISDFLQKYSDKLRLHDKMRFWLLNCFDYAVKNSYLPPNSNPMPYIDKKYKLPRSQDLARFKDEEIAILADFLNKAWNGKTKYDYNKIWIKYIWFLIRTGTRPHNARIIKREWITEFNGHHIIKHPETKTGEAIIYLSNESHKDICETPTVDGNPYLFPGRKSHLVNYAKNFSRISEEAGLTKEPYAIRRWFASVGRRLFDGDITPIKDLVGWENEEMALRYAGDDDKFIDEMMLGNVNVCNAVASRINEVTKF